MRYFFHVTADGLKSPDEEGKDFDTFEAARAEAIESRFGLKAGKWLRLVRPWRPA